MPESPFDHLSAKSATFPISQCDDIMQSVMNEIGNFRPLSCVTGFPKSGKTFFAERLKQYLQITTFLIQGNGKDTLSQILHAHLARFPADQSTLAAQLKTNKRVVLIIDNAHLLRDEDFAVISTFFTLAEQTRSLLQVVLIGNGEIIQRFTKPDNRAIFKLLGNIWHIPKLTREQAKAYIHFLFESAGLSHDIIPNPEPLVKRAVGSIGMLRTLTITMALKALSGQDIKDTEGILALRSNHSQSEDMPFNSNSNSDEELPVQEMITTTSSWVGKLLFLGMIVAIGIFLLLHFGIVPRQSFNHLTNSRTARILPVSVSSNDTAVIQAVAPAKQPQIIIAKEPDKTEEKQSQMSSHSTAVFRKQTKDGPYSLLVGTYLTSDALIQNVQRFTGLEKPLYWDKTRDTSPRFELFIGRFDNFSQASQFSAQHKLTNFPVVFRPFMVTIGPVTNNEQIHNASQLSGIPELYDNFSVTTDSGREMQFALERTKDDAMAQCKIIESKGLACVITQFE